MNNSDIVSELEINNIKMQQTALNLLKQLPPETQIPKLGNLTVAELILQLETTLQAMNWETQWTSNFILICDFTDSERVRDRAVVQNSHPLYA